MNETMIYYIVIIIILAVVIGVLCYYIHKTNKSVVLTKLEDSKIRKVSLTKQVQGSIIKNKQVR